MKSKKRVLLVSILLSFALTGCEYNQPKPSKSYGLSRTRQTSQVKTKAPFLERFINNQKKKSAEKVTESAPSKNQSSSPVDDRQSRLNSLRKKYGITKPEQIDKKDLLGMMEIYSEDIKELQNRIQ